MAGVGLLNTSARSLVGQAFPSHFPFPIRTSVRVRRATVLYCDPRRPQYDYYSTVVLYLYSAVRIRYLYSYSCRYRSLQLGTLLKGMYTFTTYPVEPLRSAGTVQYCKSNLYSSTVRVLVIPIPVPLYSYEYEHSTVPAAISVPPSPISRLQRYISGISRQPGVEYPGSTVLYCTVPALSPPQ